MCMFVRSLGFQLPWAGQSDVNSFSAQKRDVMSSVASPAQYCFVPHEKVRSWSHPKNRQETSKLTLVSVPSG